MSILLPLHMLFAVASIIGLTGRVVLKIKQPELLQHKLIKILPHVNDTLLLLAGFSTAMILKINPMEQTWLLAKLVGIIFYIGLGIYTIKIAKSNLQTIVGCFCAITLFIWIASVVVLHSPLGFLALV